MKEQQNSFIYQEFESENELTKEDALLLGEARKATVNAYAPYSNFLVGAAARLQNNKIVTGTNQENASFPTGICAERVLLSAASSLYPKIPVQTIAVSYNNLNGQSGHPVSPCGICRQTLQEYEERGNQPIRLIMAGLSGKIIIIPTVSILLPLSFTGADFAKQPA